MRINAEIMAALKAAGEDAPAVLRAALTRLRGRIALVSSFGAESAVMLALAAEIDPDVPVLFLQTGQHFPETLEYRQELARVLGLRDVRDLHPAEKQIEKRDPQGQLWAFDPDACCALRKVEPLDEAMIPFDAWITGRKRSQAATRQGLPVVEEAAGGRIKINPLIAWTPRELDAEITRRNLPRHPLTLRGYPSIGCAPCTRPVAEGEDPRQGRWAGQAKTECGIHLPTAS
ncbi:phosphoadenosine phosphosulfate reductase [Komagataeibacter rhaeticus]|uniref:phosphoadenylyl-sulfate reductase n=1 Tax=Komagataeibacter rhaeticus TaxID=215221 RepID=UPI0004D7016A|nr:phosphoadenylyl-sulfate reductase [Komagataeibacter rhaeticus]KDU94572.1 phosphoadenosine phosphosulfate reductase [Komagataeibacter rhaeticus AF1]MBL7238642.1 phosphoadenylyl-sulfate reductase [Komagataeibacter rhaeticus]MDT8872380.1 phosphoadenylyl-sulfate reductase [Komagataeibacter rhaeticus]PYD53671.1 phosphoadenosine phosphosulfate reductase [Komagataeibacter rhaeticus]